MKSLDQIDRESFASGPSPTDGNAKVIELVPGRAEHTSGPSTISLDGDWVMAAGGSKDERLAGNWQDALSAVVPGSIQTALLAAGKIPDPYVGKNDEIARAESFKTWWLKRSFQRPHNTTDEKLIFGGICDACSIWLNGTKLGEHKGMFAEVAFDVAGQLVDGENVLLVKLEPAPQRVSTGEPNDFFVGMNVGWLDTAVINNIYGWHYINLPTIGIWRSVKLAGAPAVSIVDPFFATQDADAGIVRLQLNLAGQSSNWRGRLSGTIEAENFDGDAWHFARELQSIETGLSVQLEMRIPEARQWWPVDHGKPNLYRMSLSFVSDQGVADFKTFTFGVRTIEMSPLPDGPDPDTYNWTFVVNGKPLFVKGANCCTLDALLRFDRERYDRFLRLARDSHMQLLRAWCSGMPETDDFYDLADRYGIMVLQEWPTAWNSHRIQPYDILEETIRHNTIRLRNHPSLVMWGGGNESGEPTGPAIDMMGRLSLKLDGTQPFHRGEPWGGSIHSYRVYWGREPLDSNLSLTAPFIGEFGLASVPNYETARRFLPPEELDVWPPTQNGSFTHHLPVFNLKGGLAIMAGYVADFLPNDSLQNFILGTQLAQATGMRHTLELARTRWPETTGVAYHKLTDNNPAASWASVDWYGVPKIAYHILRQAFRPLHACVLFRRLSFLGVPVTLPVFLLDDIGALRGAQWQVRVRAFNSELALIAESEFLGEGSEGSVQRLGEFQLDGDQSWSSPLFIACEVSSGGRLLDRVFYWLNYTSVQGCLFDLPRADLALQSVDDRSLAITNTGDKPTVGTHFVSPGLEDDFYCEDSFFWLDPGETRQLTCSHTQGVQVAAWNSDASG